MRSTLVLMLSAGLAMANAHAHTHTHTHTHTGTQPAAQPPATPATPAAAQPEAPPAPAPVPVPDGPVVNKQELDGGLILEDLTIGTGYEVKAGGSVVAHYHGTLKADPTKIFDSSFTRGEPVAFPLNGVIEGWGKGVPGMKVGSSMRCRSRI
jgi:FKBP-type peptidyl-prolyl cis-trans isomerase